MSDSIDDLPFYFKIGTKKDTCEASVFESDSVVQPFCEIGNGWHRSIHSSTLLLYHFWPLFQLQFDFTRLYFYS